MFIIIEVPLVQSLAGRAFDMTFEVSDSFFATFY